MWEILRKSYRVAVSFILPKPQVQASQFPVHISHFLQNCKKTNPLKKICLLGKRYYNNFFEHETCVLSADIESVDNFRAILFHCP